MRTLQIIQTLMLIAIVIGTIENAGSSTKMEQTVKEMSAQFQKLSEEHYALDKRVSTIEGSLIKK